MGDLVERPAAIVSSVVEPGERGVRVRWLGGFPQIGDRLYGQEAADEINRLRTKIESMRANDARYRYLRNRSAQDVFTRTGKAAGYWIDCEDEDGALILVTGDDADAAIDAAMANKAMAELQHEAQTRGEY